jgi:L-lactate dehydrogenase complex protein LldG
VAYPVGKIMSKDSREEILRRIRLGLYGSNDKRTYPAKFNEDQSEQNSIVIPSEFQSSSRTLKDQFIEEVRKINGNSEFMENEDGIRNFIIELVEERGFSSFAIWESDLLQRLNLREVLQNKGLKPAAGNNKEEIAGADIGITEADFAIADSGTLVLMTNERQPRSVSLIPPVHVAILESNKIVASIHELFAFLTSPVTGMHSIEDLSSCMTFITGPSRTADIELNLTLGVHGPKEIFVLVYD